MSKLGGLQLLGGGVAVAGRGERAAREISAGGIDRQLDSRRSSPRISDGRVGASQADQGLRALRQRAGERQLGGGLGARGPRGTRGVAGEQRGAHQR